MKNENKKKKKFFNFDSSDCDTKVSDVMKQKIGDDSSSIEEVEFSKQNFKTYKNTFSCFLISKNGDIITSSYNGKMTLRNLKDTTRVLKSCRPHSHIRILKLSKNEDFLFTGGSDNCIKMFSSKDFKHIHTFKTNSRVLSIDLYESGSDKFLFSGTYSGRIFGWNYANQHNLMQFKDTKKQHEKLVSCVKVFQDSIISTSEDKTVKQWNIRTGKRMGMLKFPKPIFNIIPISEKEFLLQNFNNCELFVNRVQTGGAVSIDLLQKSHMFLSISNFSVSDDKTVLIGWNRLLGRLQLYNIQTKQKILDKPIYDAVFLKNIISVKVSDETDDLYVYYLIGRYIDRILVKITQNGDSEDIKITH